MNTNEIKKSLTRRAALAAKLAAIKAEIESIDETVKASLEYQDDAYIIGSFKVYYKQTTTTRLDQAFLKEHEPAAYNRSLVTKTSVYYAVK